MMELNRAQQELAKHATKPSVCDSCLMAARDEGAMLDIQVDICRTFGADLPDHICEDGKGCDCECSGLWTKEEV